jgi:hypothetical protein
MVALVVSAGCGAEPEIVAPPSIASSTTQPRTTPTVARTTSTRTSTSTSATTTAPTSTTAPPAPETIAPPTTTGAPPATAPPGPVDVGIAWEPFEPRPGQTGIAALTGLPADDVTAARAVIAVKIDNAPAGRPQWSLEWADVVVEENVERVTRFVALFHSASPTEAGPVRSMRTGDLPIVAALNRPVVAWSGGNRFVNRAVRDAATAGVLIDVNANEFGDCYRRDRNRRAPHNLIASMQCLRDRSDGAGGATPLWSFAIDPPIGGEVWPTADIPMDGVNVRWEWDGERYLRTQNGRAHVAASGARIAATNIVVLTVAHEPSPADPRSPEPQTLGSGPLVLYRNGLAFVGTWSREQPTHPFTLTATNGSPLALSPGTTWIELAR